MSSQILIALVSDPLVDGLFITHAAIAPKAKKLDCRANLAIVRCIRR